MDALEREARKVVLAQRDSPKLSIIVYALDAFNIFKVRGSALNSNVLLNS